jgi:hypothetical protein
MVAAEVLVVPVELLDNTNVCSLFVDAPRQLAVASASAVEDARPDEFRMPVEGRNDASLSRSAMPSGSNGHSRARFPQSGQRNLAM